MLVSDTLTTTSLLEATDKIEEEVAEEMVLPEVVGVTNTQIIEGKN